MFSSDKIRHHDFVWDHVVQYQVEDFVFVRMHCKHRVNNTSIHDHWANRISNSHHEFVRWQEREQYWQGNDETTMNSSFSTFQDKVERSIVVISRYSTWLTCLEERQWMNEHCSQFTHEICSFLDRIKYYLHICERVPREQQTKRTKKSKAFDHEMNIVNELVVLFMPPSCSRSFIFFIFSNPMTTITIYLTSTKYTDEEEKRQLELQSLDRH
jgi:hypothetical protein